MDRKITFLAFVIVILFLNNVSLLYSQANDKKEAKIHPNERNSTSAPSQKNVKGETKGKSGKEKPTSTLDLDIYSDYACNNPATNCARAIPEVIQGLLLRLELLEKVRKEEEKAETAFRTLYHLMFAEKGAAQISRVRLA